MKDVLLLPHMNSHFFQRCNKQDKRVRRLSGCDGDPLDHSFVVVQSAENLVHSRVLESEIVSVKSSEQCRPQPSGVAVDVGGCDDGSSGRDESLWVIKWRLLEGHCVWFEWVAVDVLDDGSSGDGDVLGEESEEIDVSVAESQGDLNCSSGGRSKRENFGNGWDCEVSQGGCHKCWSQNEVRVLLVVSASCHCGLRFTSACDDNVSFHQWVQHATVHVRSRGGGNGHVERGSRDHNSGVDVGVSVEFSADGRAEVGEQIWNGGNESVLDLVVRSKGDGVDVLKLKVEYVSLLNGGDCWVKCVDHGEVSACNCACSNNDRSNRCWCRCRLGSRFWCYQWCRGGSSDDA